MTSFAEIERIVARYDTATTELDQAVTGRIADSLDASYRNLERELRRLYPTWQSDGSLFAVQRRLLLMEQLGEVLAVVRPEMQGEYEALLTEALQISHERGGRMADELIRARDPGYPLQEFTTVPIEAAVAQARDGVQRLYRYNDEFKTSVSGVVETGLLQGWGADKVARILRGNEQMQGRFGLAQLKSKAETIARTEVMSAFNTATQQRYAENGITHIQWLVTPSERLCSYCLARHGNVYKLGEVTAPSHPRCRCITTSWLPKWQERGWTQDEAIAADKATRLEEMKALGTRPNYGPTSWERRAGLTEAPQPVWKPGDAAPKAAARAAAPVAAEAKPRLNAKAWNPNALPELTAVEFREAMRNRDRLSRQDDPAQAWNQAKADFNKVKRSKFDLGYDAQVREVIADGYIPSPAAIASVKLKKPELAKIEENRQAQVEWRQQIDRIDRAVSAPIAADKADRWKPRMSEAEATEYMQGSFFGEMRWYHGNKKTVTDSIATEGAMPERNDRGIYGQGVYFGIDKRVGELYGGGAFQGDNSVGMVTAQIRAQNPYIATTEQIATMGKNFSGDQSNGVDSVALTRFLRAKGYDSIYLQDTGYGVAFDTRQVVTVEHESLDARRDELTAFVASIPNDKAWPKENPNGRQLGKLDRTEAGMNYQEQWADDDDF